MMESKLRVKCPTCGEICNIAGDNATCPKCKAQIPVSPDACFYLYRQGSPFGMAAGFGVYVNGQPFGHIGNKELLCFPVPYGKYILHCASGMNRRCTDVEITLTPENRYAYLKVFMKPGFWTNSFVLEPMDPKLLGL